MRFEKATKKQAKGRVALFGPSGSGKTYTSLILARELAAGGRVAVIDTESGSASKYADEFDFDTCGLPDFSPKSYVAAIGDAAAAGYAAVVVDSLSHAWMGRGGVLEIVDNATAASRSRNAYTTGWKEATPEHNKLIEAIVGCRTHLVVTMRSKTDYVIDESNGKKAPRKVGLAPVQREGMEYEFDIVGDMDCDSNRLTVSKSRCRDLNGGVFVRPDATFGQAVRRWLEAGVPAEPTLMATTDQISAAHQYLSHAADPPKAFAAACRSVGVDRFELLTAENMSRLLDRLKEKAEASRHRQTCPAEAAAA